MSAYTYNLIAGNGLLTGMHWGPVHARNTLTMAMAKRAKNVALFLVAPFIGLAYLLAFPVVGFGMVVWVAANAVMKNEKARSVALWIAAPVIALGFVLIGPIVGLGALAWIGVKALLNK